MQVDSYKKAWEVLAFADEHSNSELKQVLDRGFKEYAEGGGEEDLIEDVDTICEWAFNPTIRTKRFDEPKLKVPGVLAVLSTLASCAIRKHEYLENAPPEKIQLIQHVQYMHTNLLMTMMGQFDPDWFLHIGDRLYEKELDQARPHPACGATAIVLHEDADPEFDKFFEIPMVAATERCKARFHGGSWGGRYGPEDNEAVGETHYHIRDNNIYVPIEHAEALLWERQSNAFEALIEFGWEAIDHDEIQTIFNESKNIQPEIEDLLKHGDKDQLWTDWDPQENLLRLVRNAANQVDDLDPTEYNKARVYYDAIEDYGANGFGESSAKERIKSVRSLANSLATIADSADYKQVDVRRYDDRRNSEYAVGSNGSGKQITLDSLDDIFELPCFKNMVEALKLENSGPVRKDLYNFVRMVYWLEGYHNLPEQQREDAVVDDIHDLFESKWDWYDRETTDYQARYELRNGDINGNTPFPMHCDNPDMQSHCIGKHACPYSIYGSLPFPQEMYDQLEDNERGGQQRLSD
ncbi:primase-associated protein [Haloarcula sp. Atlit-7R]|uniref:primase-associated protein n=1 Tax=Haloarcula sp. Atlit-7R TaxID=2282125 RepID=UPI000EF173FB|nr:primase-associated protein [Haloarcula sp. Atlit-7R]RLM94331.1 hypothetical protein D3D01_15835 [Haloarcula sp. Atlit-7R]